MLRDTHLENRIYDNLAECIKFERMRCTRRIGYAGIPKERPDGLLEWGIMTADAGEVKISYEPARGEEGKEKLAVKALSGMLSYEGFLPDIRLEYSLTGHDLKENLVLLNPEAVLSNPDGFTFLLRLENRTAVQKDVRSISILTPEGEEEYALSAPYMADAEGVFSTDLSLILDEGGEPGLYFVRLIPDREWLLAEDRVYPVSVDPSIAFAYSGYHTLQNVTVLSFSPTTPPA